MRDSTLYDISLLASKDNGQSFQLINQFKPLDTVDALNPTGIIENSDASLVVSFVEFPSFLTKSVRSTDLGKSFTDPIIVSDRCGECPTFPGYPFLASGQINRPFSDNLYHVCIGKDFSGIWFSGSKNRGKSWEKAIRIDSPPNNGNAHVRTAMLAVNNQGVVGVAWYDRRNDPQKNCQDIYFTASTDGGQSFVEPVRISTEISCPSTEGNGRTSNSWPGGGDYSSMTTDADGVFHIVWSDSRSGTAQIRHAAIEVK